jgi:hypothetical protein
MAKTKKIAGLFLLSVLGASSALAYGIKIANKKLQEEGCNEEEATNRLLEMSNEESSKKKESIKNSKNFWKKLWLKLSLAQLESEKILLD